MEIRDARPDEYDEIGDVTMRAYAEFFDDGAIDEDTSYLRRIGDVAGRASRTTIVVAVDDDGAIVGSLTLELDGRVGGDGSDTPRSRPARRTSGCWASTPRRGRAASAAR